MTGKKSGWDWLRVLGGLGFCVVMFQRCTTTKPKPPAVARVSGTPDSKSKATFFSSFSKPVVTPADGIPHRSTGDVSLQGVDAQRTKAAWDQLGLADLKVRSYRSDQVRYWEQSYLRYGEINTDYIDPDLRALIQDWVGLSVETHDLLVRYLQERSGVGYNSANAAQLGAAIGSTNQDNPEGGAVIGALLFSLLSAAASDAELSRLNAKYEPTYKALARREQDILRRKGKINEVLAQRYGLPFHRKF